MTMDLETLTTEEIVEWWEPQTPNEKELHSRLGCYWNAAMQMGNIVEPTEEDKTDGQD